MWLINRNIFVVLFSAFCLHYVNAETCEETETSHAKLDLAQQSIFNAKAHYPKCSNETDGSNCTEKDRSLGFLNAALDLIAEAKLRCRTCPEQPKIIVTEKPEVIVTEEPEIIVPRFHPIDCSEILNKNSSSNSGVYQIWPKTSGTQSNKSIEVYCDMKTDGGGWTLLQRRGNFSYYPTSFFRGWEEYKNGFGNLQQEFWLGNENIFTLTNQGNYSVRFDLVDVKREYRYAAYSSFHIDNESSGYVLYIKNHSGNATDDLKLNNGQKFSTKDKKNDNRSGSQCSVMYDSAFWFGSGCGFVNPNGVYQPGVVKDNSIWWYNWKSNKECLDAMEIKIRRRNF